MQQRAANPSTVSDSAVESLLRAEILKDIPTIDTNFKIALGRYDIPGLQQSLRSQAYRGRLLSAKDGQQFNEMLFLYRDGQIMPFGAVFGGFGLMSAVVVDDILYCSYSWGSGMHRSQIARISERDGTLRIEQSPSFYSVDLFVRDVDGHVAVEQGTYTGFNASTGDTFAESIEHIFGRNEPAPLTTAHHR